MYGIYEMWIEVDHCWMRTDIPASVVTCTFFHSQ